MLERVTIRASDLEASMRFYTSVLRPIGGGAGDFAVEAATADRPPTQHLHVGFYVPDHALVHAFWQAGIDAGHADDGEPGPRTQYAPDYYGGFLLDPDGNSAEAMFMDVEQQLGQVDHLWVRVRDAAAARDVHRPVFERAGWLLARDTPERVGFRMGETSVDFVRGEEPTRNVEIALAPGAALIL